MVESEPTCYGLEANSEGVIVGACTGKVTHVGKRQTQAGGDVAVFYSCDDHKVDLVEVEPFLSM
jgi:hypothetical protein